MANFWGNFFGNNKNEQEQKTEPAASSPATPAQPGTPRITVEKIEQLFAYGQKKNEKGMGITDSPFKGKLGENIIWEKDSYTRKDGTVVPPYVKWYMNPQFAYVALVDGKVQYHYGEENASAIFICPVTTDPEKIMLIDSMFDFYYERLELFEYSSSPDEPSAPAPKISKMKLLETYLADGTDGYFKENVADADNVLVWIDWREDDEDIVRYFNTILKAGLKARFESAADGNKLELIITYKGEEYKVAYPNPTAADRDTTIKTLNELIKPDYEIRRCNSLSDGDTLPFLPLSQQQWLKLDEKFGAKVAKHFTVINKDAKLFS